eukprot:SAG31_NODE_44066_length_264_cov_0.927273_1_plen_32_part_01
MAKTKTKSPPPPMAAMQLEIGSIARLCAVVWP